MSANESQEGPLNAFRSDLRGLLEEQVRDGLERAGIEDEASLDRNTDRTATALETAISERTDRLMHDISADDIITLSRRRRRGGIVATNPVSEATALGLFRAAERLLDEVAELPEVRGNPVVERHARDLALRLFGLGEEMGMTDVLMSIKLLLAEAETVS